MIVTQKNAEYYQWGDHCEGWQLLKQPKVSVIQERMPSGTQEIKHYHNQAEQFFFVLEGKLLIEIDGKEYNLNPKDGLYIPPKTKHQVKNISVKVVEFLVVSASPSHRDRIVDL